MQSSSECRDFEWSLTWFSGVAERTVVLWLLRNLFDISDQEIVQLFVQLLLVLLLGGQIDGQRHEPLGQIIVLIERIHSLRRRRRLAREYLRCAI